MDTHRQGKLDEELSETEMSPTLEPYEVCTIIAEIRNCSLSSSCFAVHGAERMKLDLFFLSSHLGDKKAAGA